MHQAWLDRWSKGQTGWHEAAGNANLKAWWRASGQRVLVPLCGKSPDLLWLEQQGNEVVGVELSEIAVQSFFSDFELEFERRDGVLDEYRAVDRRITLYCGDYFSFADDGFDAHYDRGALVALPPDLRKRYAEHTSARLNNHPEQLVITLEYDQSACKGPPYSVRTAEIQRYWPTLTRVAEVDDTANAPPKFLQAGIRLMHEVVWRTG